MGTKLLYVGNYPTTTEEGAPISPGETVEIDADSEYYKSMIDAGHLVDPEAQPEGTEPPPAEEEEESTRKAASASKSNKEG